MIKLPVTATGHLDFVPKDLFSKRLQICHVISDLQLLNFSRLEWAVYITADDPIIFTNLALWWGLAHREFGIKPASI